MAHVIKTMADTLPDDPWHAYFKAPEWLQALIAKGALGQKTGAGILQKRGKDIVVLDLTAQDYRPRGRSRAEVAAILKDKDPGAEVRGAARQRRIRRRSSCGPSSATCSTTAPIHLSDIADTARDVDFAIRWGYGWTSARSRPGRPRAGSRSPMDRRGHRRRQGMSNAPLPAWVFDGRRRRARRRGQLRPAAQRQLPRSAASRLQAPALPRSGAGRGVPTPGKPCWRTTACACGTTATASASSRSRPRCTPSTTSARRHAARHRRSPTGLPGPGDLADRRSHSPPAPT